MAETKGWGIASLILSILSLFLFLAPYIGIVLAILAVVFYGVQKKHNPTGVGTAGLIVGIISLSGYIIFEKIYESILINEIKFYQKGYDDGIRDTATVIFEQTENCGVSKLELLNSSKQIIDISCLDLENLPQP